MASWAKMASNLDSHPKIRAAGRDGREVFLFILRRNAELDLGGMIPKIHVQPWYVAYELMCDEVTASNGLSRAITAGLLYESEAYFGVSGWDDEWAKQPLSNAERQQRFRDKHKVVPDVAEIPTVTVTKRNDAEVTGNGSNVREESREEEKRVEKKRSDSAPRPAKRALPVDWVPREQESAKAIELGLSLAEVVSHFRDHHTANASRFTDWDAAFRNWLRNAKRFAQTRNANGSDGLRYAIAVGRGEIP